MQSTRSVLRRALLVLGFACAGVAGSAPGAMAQSGREAHWGLRATLSPKWEVPSRVLEVDFLADYLGADSKISGGELAVGVVRGSRLGGDWGLSYVRKTLSNSSRIEISGGQICLNAVCGDIRDIYTTSGSAFHGLELHKFIPFGTIKRRVQIGMNLGAGAVLPSGGTVTKESIDTVPEFDSATRQVRLVTNRSTATFDTKGLLEDLGVPGVVPVVKVELAVAAIVARNLKVRASGGINLPGTQVFSVTGIYLFGQ